MTTTGSNKDDEPHRMRITTGGSVKSYTEFALNFLRANPHRALVLHTLPPDTTSTASSSKLHPSTLAAPRLISVAEKVKREFLGNALPSTCTGPASSSEAQAPPGLWQYTTSGVLASASSTAETATMDLAHVLAGKTKPKMTHHVYLEITLARRPLGIDTGCVSLQHFVGKKGRRGKGRGKKGSAAENGGEAAAAETAATTIAAATSRPGKRKSLAEDPAAKRVKTTST